MRLDLARGSHRAAALLLVAAWAAAAHYTTALVTASSWGALLGLAPFVAVAALFAWHSRHRAALLALLGLASAGLAAAWPALTRNVGWMYFVQHVGTNALLGVGFGRSLAAGRVPLCTRVAAITHGEPSAALRAYTRRVTVAWTLFFAVVAATSVALFAFAPLGVWSTFANLLTFPLVALMFAAEYAVRLRALPPEDRGGILDAIRAYFHAPPTATPERPSAALDR